MVKIFVMLNSLSICEHICVTNTKWCDGFLDMVYANHTNAHIHTSIDRLYLNNGYTLLA